MIDDILIDSKNINKIDTTAKSLKEHFHIKDFGILKHYLEVEIRRDENGFYCLYQDKYIEKILHRFDLQDAKIVSIPLDQGYFRTMAENDKYQ